MLYRLPSFTLCSCKTCPLRFLFQTVHGVVYMPGAELEKCMHM